LTFEGFNTLSWLNKVIGLEREGKAIKQIKEKRYWEKYLGRGLNIYIMGVEFSKEKRNIVGFDVEKVV